MPLFGPRLTEEQKAELNLAVEGMNQLGAVHINSFQTMGEQLSELGSACRSAQQAGLGSLTTADESILNEARASLAQRQSHIDQMGAELRGIQIRDWFPKKLRKEHEVWLGFLETERESLDMAIEAVTPPDPLVNRPGKAKLNMFLAGLNMAAIMAQPLRSRVKP